MLQVSVKVGNPHRANNQQHRASVTLVLISPSSPTFCPLYPSNGMMSFPSICQSTPLICLPSGISSTRERERETEREVAREREMRREVERQEERWREREMRKEVERERDSEREVAGEGETESEKEKETVMGRER